MGGVSSLEACNRRGNVRWRVFLSRWPELAVEALGSRVLSAAWFAVSSFFSPATSGDRAAATRPRWSRRSSGCCGALQLERGHGFSSRRHRRRVRCRSDLPRESFLWFRSGPSSLQKWQKLESKRPLKVVERASTLGGASARSTRSQQCRDRGESLGPKTEESVFGWIAAKCEAPRARRSDVL